MVDNSCSEEDEEFDHDYNLRRKTPAAAPHLFEGGEGRASLTGACLLVGLHRVQRPVPI